MNITTMRNNYQVNKFFKIKYLSQCNRYNEKTLLKMNEESIKYNLNPELIFGIITLEKMNRGSLMIRLIEICGVYLIPSFIIKKNISIGLGQIKLTTAKEVLDNLDDERVLKLLINPLKCIEVVAMLIHKYSIESSRKEKNTDAYVKKISNLYITGSSDPDTNFQIKTHFILLKWSIENNLFAQTLFKLRKSPTDK